MTLVMDETKIKGPAAHAFRAAQELDSEQKVL